MNAAGIAELLRTRIGLDSHSLGAEVLTNAVAQRMRILGLAAPESYVDLVAASATEFDALIDEVVVPETWFFRGGKVFAFLAKHVRDRIASIPTGACRILSAPCSTGEEPYSLVIALTDAGVPPERWTVDAIDVSARSLERARRARYTESAFRETPAEVRRGHFRKVENGWELNAALKERVRFRRGNLLDPHLLSGERPFELILCRNVLIYLDEPARRRVLANLDRLLTPDGLLCMGHAEPCSKNGFSRRDRTAISSFTARPRAIACQPGASNRANPPSSRFLLGPASRRCASRSRAPLRR
jgi:chemotaxis protein methyltransferase WspC